MAEKSKNTFKELEKFAELYIEDVESMSDEELIAETNTNPTLNDYASITEKALQAAIKQTGKNKLRLAKEAIELQKHDKSASPSFSADEARKIIADLKSSNDPNFTLAARNLDESSDLGAIEIAQNLYELGAINKDNNS